MRGHKWGEKVFALGEWWLLEERGDEVGMRERKKGGINSRVPKGATPVLAGDEEGPEERDRK